MNSGALINKQDSEGGTALHIACRENVDRKLIDKLLSLKADPNIPDHYGVYPIFELLNDDLDIDILEKLLKAGVDLSAKNNIGDLPLHKAARNGCIKKVEMLVSYMRQQNVSIDQTGTYGGAALHIAVFFREQEIVELLLSSGASPLVKNEYDEIPSDYSKRNGQVTMTKILEKAEKAAKGKGFILPKE